MDVPNVSVPITDYLDALMGWRDHAVIDERQKSIIVSAPGWESYCRFEPAQNNLYFLKKPFTGAELEIQARQKVTDALTELRDKVYKHKLAGIVTAFGQESAAAFQGPTKDKVNKLSEEELKQYIEKHKLT